MKWNLEMIFFWENMSNFRANIPPVSWPSADKRFTFLSITFTDTNTRWPGSGSEMLPTKVTVPYRETNSQSDCVPTTASSTHFDPTSSSFTFFPAAAEFLNTHTHRYAYTHTLVSIPWRLPRPKHVHTHTHTHTHTRTYTYISDSFPLQATERYWI